MISHVRKWLRGFASRDSTRTPRGRWLVVTILLLVGSSGVSFALGQGISNPSQLVADAAPPTPSVLTATVTRQPLASVVRARGDITLANQTALVLSSDDGEGVITAVHVEQGDAVKSGDALADVNGIARIVCPGRFPMYRTISPQDSGPDVRQFQDCLVDAGALDDDRRSGIFDAATQQAAIELFAVAGYDLRNTIDPAAVDAVEAAELAVESAGEQLTSATEAGAQAVRAREQTIADTREALEAAHQTRNQTVEQHDKAAAAAQDALEAAEAELDEARNATPQDEQRVQRAQQQVDQAGTVLEDTRREAAQAESAADTAIAEAHDQLEEAEGASVAEQRRAVGTAERTLTNAQRELVDARAAAGVRISPTMVPFVATLPRTVADVAVQVGDRVDGQSTAMSLASDQPRVIVDLPSDSQDAEVLEVGTRALLDTSVGELTGTLEALAASETSDGSVQRATISFDGAAPETVLGENVLVVFELDKTDDPVLTVPTTAIRTDATGRTYVTLAESDGDKATGPDGRVPVDVGMSVDGVVQISPASPGQIDDGDQVVIGTDHDR